MNKSSHFHHCPECYDHWECNFNCTIEPDLEDNGQEFGAHCTCPECDVILHHEAVFKESGNGKYNTKEFWDVYNGFIKVKKYVVR